MTISRMSTLPKPLKLKEITCLSMNDSKISYDRSQLSEYNELHKSYDKSKPIFFYNGINEVKKFKYKIYERGVSRIKEFLDSIIEYEQTTRDHLDSQVFCHRGELVDMVTLDKLDVTCTKRDGSLFITSNDYRENENSMGINIRKATYSGYKFEHIVTCDPSSKEFGKKLKNNYSYWKIIYGFELKKDFHITTMAEVDTCWATKRSDFSNYIECKTQVVPDDYSPEFTNQEALEYLLKKKKFFFRKLLKIVLQCRYIGINDVVIGFRGSNDELVDIRLYSTEELAAGLKEKNKKAYQVYTNADERLLSVLEEIQSKVKEGEYYNLTSSKEGLVFTELTEGESLAGAKASVFSPEFTKWRSSIERITEQLKNKLNL